MFVNEAEEEVELEARDWQLQLLLKQIHELTVAFV